MPSRPHYEVYQTQMLQKLHGFPQFAADPEGNGTLKLTEGVGKIEIGDLGYFREGRFERIIGLDLQAICGPEVCFNSVSIPLDSPECAGNVTMIELNTGVAIAPGVLQAIPFGGAPNVRLKCVKGEGAILNVQSGKATYTYCDTTSKILLGEHMLKNYKQWRSDLRGARYIEPEQLFLVTGTYMTHNWEAATFHKHTNTSIGIDVTVDAVLFEGKMSIDWTTWRNGERGFRHGHTHMGQAYPRHSTVPSFGACCSTCPEPPENQCIFLRGWRVKEFDLMKPRLPHFASVESTEKEELRMKRPLSLFGRSSSANAARTTDSSEGVKVGAQLGVTSLGLDQRPVASLMEAEGTPIPTGCADIYDFVAATKFQLRPQETILLHDDEVIEFFTNSDMGLVHPDSEERRSDPKSAVSHLSDLVLRRNEIEHELLMRNNLHRELTEIDATIEKAQEKKVMDTVGRWASPSPSIKMEELDEPTLPMDVSTPSDIASSRTSYLPMKDTPSRLDSSNKSTGRRRSRDRKLLRREVETRAGEKHESAMKRLQHVLDTRTHVSRKDGIESQIMTAAVQMEKDGIQIAKQEGAAKELKVKVVELEAVVEKLRDEINMQKRIGQPDVVPPSIFGAKDLGSGSDSRMPAASMGETDTESFQNPVTQQVPESLMLDQTRMDDDDRIDGKNEIISEDDGFMQEWNFYRKTRRFK